MSPKFSFFNPPTQGRTGLNRRQFILGSGLLLGAVAVPNFVLKAASTLAAPHRNYAQFLELSQFLLAAHPLNEQVAHRIHDALSGRDPAFEHEVTALLALRTAEAWVDVDAFGRSAHYQNAGDSRRLALSIISAWYLGYVGTPSGNTAHDDAQFITYTQALMYQPTVKTLVIPSYVKWGTNYWAQPPILGVGA